MFAERWSGVQLKDVKLLCEAEVACSGAKLIWRRVFHNAPFKAKVFTSIFRSPNGFQQFGGVTFATVFKALIMLAEAGFELRLATAITMPCSCS